jgi:hypothetical protein
VDDATLIKALEILAAGIDRAAGPEPAAYPMMVNYCAVAGRIRALGIDVPLGADEAKQPAEANTWRTGPPPEDFNDWAIGEVARQDGSTTVIPIHWVKAKFADQYLWHEDIVGDDYEPVDVVRWTLPPKPPKNSEDGPGWHGHALTMNPMRWTEMMAELTVAGARARSRTTTGNSWIHFDDNELRWCGTEDLAVTVGSDMVNATDWEIAR